MGNGLWSVATAMATKPARKGKTITYATLLLFPMLALAPSVEGKSRSMTHHATGTFVVSMTPEAQAAGPAGGVPTSRLGLLKTFSGGLEGSATGTMIAAGAPKPGSAAAYVAIDQFTGKLDGRSGGFVLVHRGTMTKAGAADLQVVVAPDSGTGELEGLSGTLTIRVEGGKHYYDLDYSLPKS
jgi:Protein of unknown function (DUF3224)